MLVSLPLLAVETVNLNPNNTVNLRGEVSAESVKQVMMEIQSLRERNPLEKIYLVINSPGGSVLDGMDLIRFLDTQDNIDTITFNAASMASAIVEANKGKRLILRDSTMMFHRARLGVQGQVDGELESELAMYKKLINILEKQNADRIGISLKEYKENIINEWWVIGEENIDKNVADSVVKVKCSSDLIKQTEEKQLQIIFFTVTAKYSKCPLFSNPIEVKNNNSK